MDAKQKIMQRLDGVILACRNQNCSLRYAADQISEAVIELAALPDPSTVVESPPTSRGDEPAFPARVPTLLDSGFRTGITMREYFAATAPIDYDTACAIYGGEAPAHQDAVRAAFFAVWAMARWEYADQMLKARER